MEKSKVFFLFFVLGLFIFLALYGFTAENLLASILIVQIMYLMLKKVQ
ncbi:hypothetical protein J4476_03270 [Candidatus Woesearchaeota archaeon]|nr:hypothetical protein [Candidatus Woesearchaeota archaeon]HIH25699.1 hypothetical protein [Nanoarchaeota archaeon]